MNNCEIYFDYVKLHRTLKENGGAISDIAQICGLSRSTLYKKLNGEREFKVSEYIMLCKYLKIPIDELVKVIILD